MSMMTKMMKQVNPKSLTSTTNRLLKPTTVCTSSGFSRYYAKSAGRKEKATEAEEVEGAFETPPPQLQEDEQGMDDPTLTSGISRPLSDILKELNRKVPDSLIKLIRSPDGFSTKYIPWHIVNRIMNLHAPEWSGEVRSITYSADGNSVSVVYRVTLYGIDAEIYRESTGTACIKDTSFGDPVQKAEAMAFRRACARLGLGLHLYHEDL